MKNIIIILAVLILMPVSLTAGQPSLTMPEVNYSIPIGDEKLPDVAGYPYIPGTTADTGIALDYTYYDMQSIGSSRSRIAVCDNDDIYVCWLKLNSWPNPSVPQGAWYGRVNSYGNCVFTGSVDNDSSMSTGSPALDIIYRYQAAITYHRYGDGLPPHLVVACTDGTYHYPPCHPEGSIWPNITVNRYNYIYIVSHALTGGRYMETYYTVSYDGGNNWIIPHLIDTCMTISTVMDASPISDRVVIAYAKSQDTLSQWHNDIVYYVSEYGTYWDWLYGRHNITNYGTDNDSLWAYTDLDVMFDYNDYIHIIWNAQWVTDQGVYYRTYLLHYNEETDSITTICYHPDSLWEDVSGAWNRPICKMNLGCFDGCEDVILTTWTLFDTSDVSAAGFGNGDIYMTYSLNNGRSWQIPQNITYSRTPGCFPGDCSSEHWGSIADNVHGYLHLTYVKDKDAGSIILEEGASTESPVVYKRNDFDLILEVGSICGTVTEIDGVTPIEGAVVKALTYSDRYCGGITGSSGSYYFSIVCGHYNIMAYKEGYQSEILYNVIAPWDYPGHAYFQLERTVDIDDNRPLPYIFQLNLNYPNPFNAQTTISFELPEPSPVSLEIYDITGAKVATLLDSYLPANRYEVIWDAEDCSSGIYFYKLKTEGETLARKAVIIK